MAPTSDLDRRIAGIAALDQPLRRELYRVLGAAGGWVSRDDAAAALGVPRSVAAFHLDKLAEAGVVEVHFARTSGRQGPGAGRPSKLYRAAGEEVSASVPDRHYDLAGSLLATAIVESTRTGSPVEQCLHAAAQAAGRTIGAEAHAAVDDVPPGEEPRAAVVDVLARHGYEPEEDEAGEIALANCPFHRLAEEHRTLVCGMNLDFLDGLLDGMGPDDRLAARLDPAPGYCCVRISAPG
ncbi:MAG TPA: helix-turn-helix domain-containing protein [Acidimicrobiales bacterium]|jgi:predicted ArsR family transcriptional regulator|nr:helix-turn-helix domain-containing protein [Acidimicrobiales bacterium]